MVLNASSLGVWRGPALLYGLKYSTDKKRLLRSMFGELDFFADIPGLGSFHCTDIASAYQFMPGWERAIKQEVLSLRDSVFLDVGSNIGYYSVLAAKKGNRAIAIEPNPRTFACLKDTIRLNRLESSVQPLNVAAWSSNSPLKMASSGYSDVSQISKEGEPVQGVTIDSILHGLDPQLVKLDVEGSEWDALLGMKETIYLHHPKIIFEALSSEKLGPCKMLLKEKGYGIIQLDSTNYLAVP